MRIYPIHLSVLFAACLASLSSGFSQTSNSRATGRFDSEISVPGASPKAVQQDPAAIAEITAHVRAVGGTAWTGMQGTGTIVYGSDDTTSFPATIAILGSQGFRLDTDTVLGPTSMRVFGKVGAIQDHSGRLTAIPFATSASGIVQFPLLLQHDFPDATTSIIDQGPAVVDKVSLRRLEIAFAASPKGNDRVVTDVYLDPASHLLIKSVNTIRLTGAGSAFLRVNSYEDYRLVDGAMIPFRLTQTLDGQKQWTLQLSVVQLNPRLDYTFFKF